MVAAIRPMLAWVFSCLEVVLARQIARCLGLTFVSRVIFEIYAKLCTTVKYNAPRDSELMRRIHLSDSRSLVANVF